MPAMATLTPPEDVPLYWFAALELAIEAGDFRKAAEAQEQLARLGVSVTHRRPRPAAGTIRQGRGGQR